MKPNLHSFLPYTFLLTCLMGMNPLCLGAGDWFSHAIWYQIFPERFRNGDPSNDPIPESLKGTWPYSLPAEWKISPWTSDWYALQPWESADGQPFYVQAQRRRYGGDLQGILDKLDYLQTLGVNALYLNPVFESPSLHKYGATLYHHIDRHFGPDPKGDLALFAQENPGDPTTWQWSSADQLFLELIREVHRRNMKIIIDGVFNHVGIPFWALQKAREQGPQSPYAQWFHIHSWDDPATPEDEFDYQGWVGIKDLPEFARTPDNLHPEVRKHLHSIVQRWMDPNQDGNPEDGIDGWRLDVAAEVPMGFWKEFRQAVKTLTPQAYLTGEIWWDDYARFTFRDATPWLDQAFDGVMNYRFGDAGFQFFLHPQPISSLDLAKLLGQIHETYGYNRILELQNLYNSHDTARIGSALRNPQYRQDHDANLQSNPNYDISPPTPEDKQIWKQLIVFQMLMPGAPFLYYGDEIGMWGADDPDCRKPMVWSDLNYTPEKAHPFDPPRTAGHPVHPDHDLYEFYREWIGFRTRHPATRTGSFEILSSEEMPPNLFAFQRKSNDESIIAIFNNAPHPQPLPKHPHITLPPKGFQVFTHP